MAAKAAKWGIVLFWATLILAENKQLFLTFLLGSAEESKHVKNDRRVSIRNNFHFGWTIPLRLDVYTATTFG